MTTEHQTPAQLQWMGPLKRFELCGVGLEPTKFKPDRLCLIYIRPNPHRTRDAMQIRMFFLWCCLRAVWTPPFTSTGPICLRRVVRGVLHPVWIGPKPPVTRAHCEENRRSKGWRYPQQRPIGNRLWCGGGLKVFEFYGWKCEPVSPTDRKRRRLACMCVWPVWDTRVCPGEELALVIQDNPGSSLHLWHQWLTRVQSGS